MSDSRGMDVEVRPQSACTEVQAPGKDGCAFPATPKEASQLPWPDRGSRNRCDGVLFGKKLLFPLVLTLTMSGCYRPIGPRSIVRDRAQYSVSLSDSWKEQTLLNIVKMRYLDPPIFVDIGNIVASYSLAETAALGATVEPGNNSGTIAGGGTYTNSPTITYTPLTGSKFVTSLMTPLSPGAVFAGIQNGLPADTTMFAALSSINGLKNQEAQLDGIKRADPDFHRVRELARRIQLSGAVRTYVKLDANKQESDIVAFRTKDVPPETLQDIAELRRLLRLNPIATEFKIVFGADSSSDTEVAVETRSILALMQTMAAQVEVPSEHLAQTRAFAGFEKEHGNPSIVRLIRIHSDKKRSPDAFVSVYYRDYWFWIDDGDLESKQVFSLMMTLFTMADSSPRENLPVITIPAH
jgi:hypothetical protein